MMALNPIASAGRTSRGSRAIMRTGRGCCRSCPSMDLKDSTSSVIHAPVKMVEAGSIQRFAMTTRAVSTGSLGLQASSSAASTPAREANAVEANSQDSLQLVTGSRTRSGWTAYGDGYRSRTMRGASGRTARSSSSSNRRERIQAPTVKPPQDVTLRLARPPLNLST